MTDDTAIQITKRTVSGDSSSDELRRRIVVPPVRRRLVIDESEVQQLKVTRPKNGAAVHELFCRVTGSAGPRVDVWLQVNSFKAKATCGPDAKFTFSDVPLKPGTNELRLGFSGHDESKAQVSVTVKDPFLHRNAKDPATKERFKAGDDVVRCTNDKTYVFRAVWLELGYCPICQRGRFCDSNDPAFFVMKGG